MNIRLGVSSNTSIDPISMIKYMKDHILAIRDKHNELEITDFKTNEKTLIEYWGEDYDRKTK